jgi:dedicated sortase system histidine kinase
MGAARAVATALHDRPLVLPPRPLLDTDPRRMAEEELKQLAAERGEAPPEVPAPVEPTPEAVEHLHAILKGLERTTSRIWVVNRDYRVLALAGTLRRPRRAETSDWASRASRALFSGLISGPREDFEEGTPEDVLASGKEVAAALQGAPRSRARHTPDGRAVVLSAAQPIWNGDEIAGAVIVEETTNSILSVRSRALERLLLATLAAFVLAAAVLLGMATRISLRIRRLRDEAEGAIDAQGRIGRRLSGSTAGDEIGDLSRSFSAVLARLAEHHTYLETMASRLSHELRTPVAVVRSSLENMKLGGSAEENAVYLARAEDGLARLTTILTRMSEASRLEQSLGTTERERFDLRQVLRGCVEGYRLAFPGRVFDLLLPPEPVMIEGSPDLLAQLLDKLVDNANDFGAPGTPVTLELTRADGSTTLAVTNLGDALPEGMRDRLFASMVSVRKDAGGPRPHLGLGLHVARMIAEFHRGTIRADNLQQGGTGVRVTLTLPTATEG